MKAKHRNNAKLIVVDPRPTHLATKADLWLQIRPGTDLALALGMINTVIDEELYDKKFVDKWCYGFEKLREHLKDYRLEKVAAITCSRTRPRIRLLKVATAIFAEDFKTFLVELCSAPKRPCSLTREEKYFYAPLCI